MITSFIGWAISGLVAGANARFPHPGHDQMGLLGTIVLGVLGSPLGGGIAYARRRGTYPYAPAGWIVSIRGAIPLSWGGLVSMRPRTTSCPTARSNRADPNIGAAMPRSRDTESGLDSHPGLEGLERLAWLMDRAIAIPGTRFRVGLDAILGLLPIGGDVLAGIVQVGIVVAALAHYKVPRAVAARMAANVLLDTTVGALPLVGDAFDAVFKANTRNLRLLKEVQQRRSQGQAVSTAGSWAFLAVLVLGLLGVLLLLLVGFATVASWAYHQVRATAGG